MEAVQEYRGLIEKIILSNKRFKGNEDFFEDFCSETFKRSYRIVSSIKNVEYIESYLSKVSNSAILEVLKTSGRLTKTSSGYQKIQQQVVNVKDDVEYSSEEIIYDIPDPAINIEEKIIQKDTIEQIAKILFEIDSNHPEKNYLELFKLRYIKNLRQSEIAQQLELSQGEISKRLVEITKKINEVYCQNSNQY